MSKGIKDAILYALNILLGLIVISPLIYALLISFMPQNQIFTFPPKLIPKSFYIGNYVNALKTAPIVRLLMLK